MENKGEPSCGKDLWNRSGTGGPGAYDIEGGPPDPRSRCDRDPGKDRESCTAYQIASGAVPEIKDKEIIPVVFPMTKNETVLRESHEAAVQSLYGAMDQGKTIAFLTLGT